MTTETITPLAVPPDASISLPGSKSLTNRALVCAAVAEGTSVLDHALLADDTEAMVGCLRALGISVVDDGTTMTVTGTGGRVPAASTALDVRQSGTTARFIVPLVAAGEGEYAIDGDPVMQGRPMAPAIEALRALGVRVTSGRGDDRLPVTVTAGVTGDSVALPGHVTSQFLSGLLLAAPLYPRGLRVTVTSPLVSRPYVEMTRAVMRAFGVDVVAEQDSTFVVAPSRYRATTYAIEPDATAASYFFAAAAITGGRVRVERLGPASLQGDVAFVDILEQMGARVDREPDAITVTGTGALQGVEVDLAHLSDTAQTLAAVAVFADGPTRVTGIGFIREKETNRIAAVVQELWRCGIDAEEEPDGFTVLPGQPHPATIETYDDHRMAMSFALLGLVVPGIEIDGAECVAKTFPGYFAKLDQLRK